MTKQKSDKQALDNIVESTEHLEQVYKRDSQFGDGLSLQPRIPSILSVLLMTIAILFQVVFLIVKAFLP